MKTEMVGKAGDIMIGNCVRRVLKRQEMENTGNRFSFIQNHGKKFR